MRGLAVNLLILVAGLWTGAGAFFAAGGAQTVLQTAPSRPEAAPINRALLDLLDLWSVAAVMLLYALFLLAQRPTPWRAAPKAILLRLLALAFAAAIVSRSLVSPALERRRLAAPTPVAERPVGDTLGVEWRRLHTLSVLTLVVRLGVGVAVFFLALSQRDADRRAPERTIGLGLG